MSIKTLLLPLPALLIITFFAGCHGYRARHHAGHDNARIMKHLAGELELTLSQARGPVRSFRAADMAISASWN